mgnify:CR=1 FL=1|jgi:hypothetical protein
MNSLTTLTDAISHTQLVNAVNGFKENKTMDLVYKYLSRVRPEDKRSKGKYYKIYSKILEDDLWIVTTDRELKALVSKGITDVMYTQEEVSRMMDESVSEEGLKAVHKVKKSFSGAIVDSIERK